MANSRMRGRSRPSLPSEHWMNADSAHVSSPSERCKHVGLETNRQLTLF
jgi:hypothetical protein